MEPIEVNAEEIKDETAAQPVVEAATAASAAQDAAQDAAKEPIDVIVENAPVLEAAAKDAELAAAQETGIIQIPAFSETESPISIELTDEDKKLIDQRAAEIDLSNSNVVVEYGSSSQKNIADFSDNALQNVKTKDLGEVSNMITNLVTNLKGFDLSKEDENAGFFAKLFKKGGNKIESMKAKYASAEENVDTICNALQAHQNQLSKDIVMLDKMYDANLDYYKELTIYILAGKKRLEEERAGKLVELKATAEQTGAIEDAQRANDYANLLERFEKKIYDLQLTREVSIQMAPQIRLIQSSDILMVEKIQTALVNTIPLWKNQMVLALGVEDMRQATEATRQVSDMTNELLKKNAETLKQGTIDVATESERSIIEIETVEETNQKLIETFEAVLAIQEEGRTKRAAAENRLGEIETQLRNKLMEIK